MRTLIFDSRSLLQFRRLVLGAAVILFCAGSAAIADAPPSTQPAADSASSVSAIQAGIRQLGDDDPLVRDAAAQQLMGLHSADLPALHAAAMSLAPLLPAQIASLHDIVVHVYLTPDPAVDSQGAGFLGLIWSREIKPIESRGIIVERRVQGFVAYRMLRPGDVITRLLDEPDQKLQDLDSFTSAVQNMGAGQTLRLQVMRGGKSIEVSIVLDARPQDVINDQMDFERIIQMRLRKADDYWKTNYAAIDRGSITSTSP